MRRAFVRQIKSLGLTGRIDGSGVFARVSGPVATFDRAFRVRITREFGNDPNIYAYAFLGVTWPGSSACVTSVGGTRLTLNAANDRRSEVVWNDAPWVSTLNPGGAGGGGYAFASARPPFQHGLKLPGTTRMVPDVSKAASEFPGWPVVLGGYWESDAGTSGAAPLVASAMAILSADQRRRGLPPIGPADGLFYYLAAHAPRTIYDVTRGNNGYLKKVPARRATRGYDLASGLGAPNFSRVVGSSPDRRKRGLSG